MNYGELKAAVKGYLHRGDVDAMLPVWLQLHYWRRLPALVDDADTNALLTRAPGVYLSAMLVEGGRWARDDELGVREAGNYTSAVTALHSADAAARFSGDVLTMRMPR